jgi:hypothetical protein
MRKLREQEKIRKNLIRYENEMKVRLQLAEEERRNPDEFRVLPYGWSPFGLYL